MRILIDTNILIHLEDHKIIDSDFSAFYNLAISNKCEVLYHKDCLKDISRDSDEERRKIIQSKFKKYSVLKNPAKLEVEFATQVGGKKENDRIDNVQLYQLYKGFVEYFVTNDKGIHKKASKLGLDSKVITSANALKLLNQKYTLSYPSHPVIKHESLRYLENDFNTEFFDSLKLDYSSEKFTDWLTKCVKEDRNCYNLRISGHLAALLIYNIEEINDHDLETIKEKACKICTLKVGDDALGMKLGELFLNKMFQLCIEYKINYLYITTYEKQKALIYILEKFGFEKYKDFKNNVEVQETIFVKNLNKNQQQKKRDSTLHPYFRDTKNKFVIPIQTKYYSSLFKDANLRSPTLFDAEDYGLQEVQGNTIIKAYVSNSPRKDLVAGDLLFFYSSAKYKKIEPLGVLLEHKRVDNFDDLWDLVRSKTVYSQKELKKMLSERKYLTVTIFRLVQYLNPLMDFKEIKKLDCYSNKFQTITKMTESDYQHIKKKYINENFIID
jgi:DNA-binding cell septation regulator SpoVG